MLLPDRHRVPIGSPVPVAAVAAEVFDGGSDQAAVVLLAHGAGSRMDHPVHRGVANAIAAAGSTVVSFNFGYSEAGRRAADPLPALLDCYRGVAAWAAAQLPRRRIVGGGRSMGGRIASLLASDGHPFAGLVLLNYPLVASRRHGVSTPRTAHWPLIEVPVLFVHGTRDALFPLDVFEASRPLLHAPVTVHALADADHVFAVPKRAQRTPEDVYAEVGTAVGRWCATLEVHA